MAQDKPRALMLADLKRSGLTPQHATRLATRTLSARQVKALTEYINVSAYRIPYHDLRGKVTPFHRLRLMENFTPNGAKKPMRYWQPTSTLPRLYIPAVGPDWPTLAKDPNQELYITEGEKKAACGCINELPTLGLGGVWSWRSKKRRVALLPDFDQFVWEQREVFIVFDSDLNEKHEVQEALVALAQELAYRGAIPYAVKLPAPEGAKYGLDDFLVRYGREAFDELPAESLTASRTLWELNREIAFIDQLDTVIKLKTERLLSRDTLVGVTYAHKIHVSYDGKGNPKHRSAAAEWLRWPHRRTHTRLAYEPGAPKILTDNGYNLWNGWGCEPKRGNVKPWAELLEHIFKSAPEHKRWFLQWLAYPLQHPGTKLYTAVVLISLAHGVGKSLIGETVGRIYGENFSLVERPSLLSDFNDWAVRKQFVLGDDVLGGDQRREADRIKNLITRMAVEINIKYQPRYSLRDLINYLFTSNHPDAFYLEEGDRRFFVHEVKDGALPPEFYERYRIWLHEENGAAALFHLMLNLDLAGFNPRAHAPATWAKDQMRELSKSDLDMFAAEMRGDAPGTLRRHGLNPERELWTVEELVFSYDPEGRRRTTHIAMSKALRRAGFEQLSVTRLADGTTRRLWPVAHADRWRRADHHERAGHYATAAKPYRAAR